jgi:cardiolipin synthase
VAKLDRGRAFGSRGEPSRRTYVAKPQLLRSGNQLTLLRGGQHAYPAMLSAIAAAQRSVCLEVYILRSDATGERFARALRERARAGVAVRLLYDAFGSFGLFGTVIRALEEDGVEVVAFHPLTPWKQRFAINQRDHRKILVVDDEVGFIGGMNIGDEYLPTTAGGAGWYDLHCRMRGSIVRDIGRMFRQVWLREGGAYYSVPNAGEEEAAGACLARVVDTGTSQQRRTIRRAYLHAIAKASRSICIMNAYFLPDRGLRRALCRAAKRGVKVQVMVPEASDVAVVKYAGQHLYSSLLRRGVEILVWPRTMMHAKAAVIDSVWAAVGSYNLDYRSLFYNLEVMVEVVDPDFGAGLHAQFADNAALCEPLSMSAWERRPVWKKVVSRVFYQFRRWL